MHRCSSFGGSGNSYFAISFQLMYGFTDPFDSRIECCVNASVNIKNGKSSGRRTSGSRDSRRISCWHKSHQRGRRTLSRDICGENHKAPVLRESRGGKLAPGSRHLVHPSPQVKLVGIHVFASDIPSEFGSVSVNLDLTSRTTSPKRTFVQCAFDASCQVSLSSLSFYLPRPASFSVTKRAVML